MILLDVFEPVELERLISQSAPVSRMPLNSQGFADVLIYAHDSHRIQIENKQADEVLGDIDGTEDQLRRQYPNAEESMLLVRGIIEPAVDGIQTYVKSSKGQIYHRGRKHRGQSYAGYRSWLYSLDKAGITCMEVPDIVAMSVAIVSIYKNAQKPEHTTLLRYIKPKIFLADNDPHIMTLMGVGGANIGEKKAKELRRVFGTPFGVFCRSEHEIAEVDGFGLRSARTLMRGIK